jgi:hypothetical protein
MTGAPTDSIAPGIFLDIESLIHVNELLVSVQHAATVDGLPNNIRPWSYLLGGDSMKDDPATTPPSPIRITKLETPELFSTEEAPEISATARRLMHMMRLLHPHRSGESPTA